MALAAHGGYQFSPALQIIHLQIQGIHPKNITITQSIQHHAYPLRSRRGGSFLPSSSRRLDHRHPRRQHAHRSADLGFRRGMPALRAGNWLQVFRGGLPDRSGHWRLQDLQLARAERDWDQCEFPKLLLDLRTRGLHW